MLVTDGKQAVPMDSRTGQEQLCLIARNPEGLAVVPEPVLLPKFGTQEFGCFLGFTTMPFVFTQGCKMLLRFKLQILSYEENVLHCGYVYASQLKQDRRYVGRSNRHDHQIQIQMFIRKKTTGGKLHN